MIKLSNNELIKLYLDWINNFITIANFSENYNLKIKQAEKLREKGRKLLIK